jgi:small subunit ribosomal protein S7e
MLSGKNLKLENNFKNNRTNKLIDSVNSIFNEFRESNPQYKEDMSNLQVENVNELNVEGNKTTVLININDSGIKNLQNVHQDLVLLLEKSLGKPVLLIPLRKTVDGKKFRKFIGKKVPRTKTLSFVQDNILEDLLYPATIIGKRTRYPRGQRKQLKVFVDSVDKDYVNYKNREICLGYRSLTGCELSIDFPSAC